MPFSICPISPFTNGTDRLVGGLCDEEGWESIGDAPLIAAGDEQTMLEPDDIIDADEDSVVQAGKPLPEPMVPTPAQVAAHNLTHLPHRSWCPHCVRARRPNTQHRASPYSTQRTTPLLVADYCYIRDCEDKDLAAVFVARVYQAKALFELVCDKKGPDDNYVVTRLAQFIKDSGYSHIVFKSDQEASIKHCPRRHLEHHTDRGHATILAYSSSSPNLQPWASLSRTARLRMPYKDLKT